MRAAFVAYTLIAGALGFSSGSWGAALADPAVPGQAPVVLTPPPGALPPPAALPQAAYQRFRGTLQEFDGPFLTLKTAEKKIVTLGMTVATRIVHNRLLQLTDLQPGAYVEVWALKGMDGKLRAQGVRLAPAGTRGANDGLYPLDPANPMRLMIGGTISTVTPGGIGGVFTVAYHGAAPVAGTTDCAGRAAPDGQGCSGTAEIQFARGVPIVSFEAGDTSILLPGATISALAAPDAGGTLVAAGVTVEKDAPPPKTH